MSYTPRFYEEIVRDMLTVLTQGTVRETLPAPAEEELLVPVKLINRPVRRISHLEGYIPGSEPDSQIPYRFTTADYELISSSGDVNELDSIRFREDGRRPAIDTEVVVNYYPVDTNPVPITDLNIGSVSRTLMETFARELAVGYLHLEHIYKSGFLDTAEGSSLDKVVALVGISRLKPGRPAAKLQFTRQQGSTGQITIPANTAITDADGNRYLLTRTLTMEPGESTREVEARGETNGTTLVEAETLTRLETLIAGIGSVTNRDAAYQLSAPETDDALRRRARVALQGNVRGTLPAMEAGIRAVEGVKDVSIIEAPNGIPGEIKIDVAFSGNEAEVLPILQRRVRELRPAGIRVLSIGEAAKVRISVQVSMVLTGSGVSDSELTSLIADAQDRLDGYFSGLPAGKASPATIVRRSKMSATLLADDRIADATVLLIPEVGAAVEELTLNEGEVLEVTGYDFPTPLAEDAPETVATTSTVHTEIPIYPEPGTTFDEAKTTVEQALNSYLQLRSPDSPIDVDSLRTALRDDTRYTIDVSATIVTIERTDGGFQQLYLNEGQYSPESGESFVSGTTNVFEQGLEG